MPKLKKNINRPTATGMSGKVLNAKCCPNLFLRFISLNPEARLSQQLSWTLWVLRSAPRKYVDLVHLILNVLPFMFHSNFRQILDKQTTFIFSQENASLGQTELINVYWRTVQVLSNINFSNCFTKVKLYIYNAGLKEIDTKSAFKL